MLVNIYYLSDPRDSFNIRYIGQTSQLLQTRLVKHISDSNRNVKSNPYKNNWIKSTWAKNNPESIKIAYLKWRLKCQS